MAIGHWRNWDSIICPNCGYRAYKKYSKKLKVKDIYYCPKCGTRMIDENTYNKKIKNA